MQQQIALMNQHIQLQAQQLHAAQQAAAAVQQQGAGAGVASRVSPPKIAPPSKFKGEMGGAVDEWIRSLMQQFAYYNESFVDDALRIKFALAYLDGSAAVWWESLPSKPTSWLLFVDRLHDRFRPIQAPMVARQKLGKMRQTSSVTAYASAFQTCLAPIPDMGDADQIHHFVNGLFPQIQLRVWEKYPKTLGQAIEAATLFEAVGHFSRSAIPYSRAPGASASSGSVPMDINRVGINEEFRAGKRL